MHINDVQRAHVLSGVCNQMKNKKYHTVGIVPKSNIKIVERDKIDTLTHKYMTAHFPCLVKVLQ